MLSTVHSLPAICFTSCQKSASRLVRDPIHVLSHDFEAQNCAHLVVDCVHLGEHDAVHGVWFAGAGSQIRQPRLELGQLVNGVVADERLADKEHQVGGVGDDEAAQRAHQRLVILHAACGMRRNGVKLDAPTKGTRPGELVAMRLLNWIVSGSVYYLLRSSGNRAISCQHDVRHLHAQRVRQRLVGLHLACWPVVESCRGWNFRPKSSLGNLTKSWRSASLSTGASCTSPRLFKGPTKAARGAPAPAAWHLEHEMCRAASSGSHMLFWRDWMRRLVAKLDEEAFGIKLPHFQSREAAQSASRSLLMTGM